MRAENYNMLIKVIKQNWRDIPCSWNGRLNIIEKYLSVFNAVVIKNLASLVAHLVTNIPAIQKTLI